MPSELKNFVLKLFRENQWLWQTDNWTSSSIRDTNIVLQLSTLPLPNSAALNFVLNEPLQSKGQLPTVWAAQQQAQVFPLFNHFATWSLMNNTLKNPHKTIGTWDLETIPHGRTVQKHSEAGGTSPSHCIPTCDGIAETGGNGAARGARCHLKPSCMGNAAHGLHRMSLAAALPCQHVRCRHLEEGQCFTQLLETCRKNHEAIIQEGAVYYRWCLEVS